MSNDTIFTIFGSIFIGTIGLFAFKWSYKEGKDMIKKLNEHEELKRKGEEAN